MQQEIANRLGWLTSPSQMAESLPRLQAFAEAVRRDGFTDVVLLGMGGSSLAVEVLRATLGVTPGWLRLRTLDSTDPAAVLAVSTPRDRTFYIFTSKSGTTIEPNAFAAPFRHGLHGWADHFIAITDEGTELAARARVERFREIFINPVDIGARYSALSFLGLVPAALMGQEMAALVGWGARPCSQRRSPGFGGPTANPGGLRASSGVTCASSAYSLSARPRCRSRSTVSFSFSSNAKRTTPSPFPRRCAKAAFSRQSIE